jgi:hypothetical protein
VKMMALNTIRSFVSKKIKSRKPKFKSDYIMEGISAENLLHMLLFNFLLVLYSCSVCVYGYSKC